MVLFIRPEKMVESIFKTKPRATTQPDILDSLYQRRASALSAHHNIIAKEGQLKRRGNETTFLQVSKLWL